MPLHNLQQATATLASKGFRPGTTANHARQAYTFIRFCDKYQLPFISPSVSTMCLYITHLSTVFTSSRSVRNYVSGVRFLHKQLSLTPETVESFPVQCLLRAADLTMRTPP